VLSIDEQVALLMQGTEYGDEQIKQNMTRELRERLIEAGREGRPLRVYCGYDPRTSDLHLGHTITMRKLRQFQELGHDVTFLIGSYTSLVGDPSDKDKTRLVMTVEEVERNARTYTRQAFKILDPARTRIRHNGEWLAGLTLLDLIKLGQNFTVQQFLARENFAKRMERGDPIYLQETFYALMQGYDAVAQETDVQIGGTDQLFNILIAGRKLQEAFGQKPQVAIIMGILPGTDGMVKMSKSLGNHIPILTEPDNMYGKVMSIPDFAMLTYYKLVTRSTPARIAQIEADLASGRLHPRDAKMGLAREIVSIFHGDEAAAQAEAHFVAIFQQHELPPQIPDFALSTPTELLEVMVLTGLARSKSDARRLIQQGGVRLDGKVVADVGLVVTPKDGQVLQVGKRRFARLVAA
jgi:tyrosyl-tRNA synthetase